MRLSTRQVTDDLRFTIAVGTAIGIQNIMEPNWRRLKHVRLLPGVPGKISLRLPRHETPVDRSDVVLLRYRQYGVKCASHGTRHVFGAKNRPMISFQRLHTRFENLRPAGIMK